MLCAANVDQGEPRIDSQGKKYLDEKEPEGRRVH